MRLKAEKERALVLGMLTKVGASAIEATSVAEVMVEADLRGIPSQGLARLPMLIQRTRTGAITTGTVPEVIQETPSIAVVDGRGGYGQHAGIQAMLLAILKAKETGIGAVAVRNANHVGILGYYAEKAARRDCIGLATSTADAAVHPYGGTEPYLGTNPIAVSAPTLGDPFILDMATSTTSMGKVIEARRRGIQLAPGVALDAQGRPTVNPEEAIRGVLSPLGGAKGYGLGLAVSLLSALSGSALGRDVEGTVEVDPPANKGDFFVAIDIESFSPLAEFKAKVSAYFNDMKGSAAMSGFGEILIPGERSLRQKARALDRGFEVYEDLWADLLALGNQIGFDVISVFK